MKTIKPVSTAKYKHGAFWKCFSVLCLHLSKWSSLKINFVTDDFTSDYENKLALGSSRITECAES